MLSSVGLQSQGKGEINTKLKEAINKERESEKGEG
jgi:hypothetical protein